MDDIVFRAATTADAEGIANLYLTTRKELLPYAPLAHSDEDVRGWLANFVLAKQDVTAALHDDQIVGFMVLARRGEIGWIDHLYLHPSAVGQGIGSQLVAQAKAALGSPIQLFTFQPNKGACRFYERHGFQAIRYGDGSGNEENCPDVLYEWRPG